MQARQEGDAHANGAHGPHISGALRRSLPGHHFRGVLPRTVLPAMDLRAIGDRLAPVATSRGAVCYGVRSARFWLAAENDDQGQVGAIQDMAGEDETVAADRRLNSWKEIAAFVGRDERTVKRWEGARGLKPVRRLPGAGRASVFAYAHEIEAWLSGRAFAGSPHAPSAVDDPPAPQPPASGPGARRFAHGALVLIAAVMVAGAIAFLVQLGHPLSAPAPPAPGTHDPAAAESYRSGLHAWQTRTPAGIARAVTDFSRAIARDPRFAAAFMPGSPTPTIFRPRSPPREAIRPIPQRPPPRRGP